MRLALFFAFFIGSDAEDSSTLQVALQLVCSNLVGQYETLSARYNTCLEEKNQWATERLGYEVKRKNDVLNTGLEEKYDQLRKVNINKIYLYWHTL